MSRHATLLGGARRSPICPSEDENPRTEELEDCGVHVLLNEVRGLPFENSLTIYHLTNLHVVKQLNN